MNMQTIQILILLLDGFIKLAPWRIVTETMDRIGYGASESLARSLCIFAAACAGLCALPTASIFGPALLTGYFGGAITSHVDPGSPLLSHLLLGFHFGVAVWAGLWWCGKSLRIDAAA
jgi:apolipoprotein N-acyltransferase